MRLSFVFIASLALLLAGFSGCTTSSSRRTKTVTHVYQGDAPTVRYSASQERAGGFLKSY